MFCMRLGSKILLAFGCLVLGLAFFGLEAVAMAQSKGIQISIPFDNTAGNLATPVKVALLVTLFTFLPAILVSATSFTRIIVVFSFLRQSLGLQSSPPNQVLVGLALFLTFVVMSPVFERMNERGIAPYLAGELNEKQAFEEVLTPLREFMYSQTRASDLSLIMDIAHTGPIQKFDDMPTSVLMPAFVLSELKTAFQIGFMIYIPFVVIDMIVAMVLLAMGMMVLPPVVISLPFKVLLFVIVDGWGLVVSSLVKSFH